MEDHHLSTTAIQKLIDSHLPSSLRTCTQRQQRDDAQTGAAAGARAATALTKDHPFADARIGEARAALAAFDQARHDHLLVLRKREVELAAELAAVNGKDRIDAEDQFREAQDELSRQQGPQSVRYQEAEQARHEARTDYDRIKAEVGRPVQVTPLRKIVFMVAVGILLLGELPVNQRAFDVVVGEAPVFTALLALLTGVVLLAVSHAIGKGLKQMRYKSKRERQLTLGLVAAGGLLLGAIVYMLAVARSALVLFLHDMANQSGGGAIVGGTGGMDAAPVIDLFAEIMTTGLKTEGMIMALLNVGLIVFAILLSYGRVDSHPYFEQAADRLRKTQKIFTKIDRAWQSRLAELTKAHKAKVAGFERRGRDLEVELGRLLSDIEAAEKSIVAVLGTVSETIAARIRAYHEGWAGAGGAVSSDARTNGDPAYIHATLQEALLDASVTRAHGGSRTRGSHAA